MNRLIKSSLLFRFFDVAWFPSEPILVNKKELFHLHLSACLVVPSPKTDFLPCSKLFPLGIEPQLEGLVDYGSKMKVIIFSLYKNGGRA